MTRARALRIVTSTGTTIEQIRRQSRIAGRSGADFAEVRVDQLASKVREQLPRLFPSKLPLLATYRSRAEGGNGADDPSERWEVLNELVSMPFALLDIEVCRDRVPELNRRSVPPERRIVLSRHLTSLADWKESLGFLSNDSPLVAFCKLVAPATLDELWREVLPSLPPTAPHRFVVHTTGPSGPLLRAWADRLGFSAVYCRLSRSAGERGPEPTDGMGQLPVDRFGPTGTGPLDGPFFAVVGHPVDHSLSPAIHHSWMRSAHQPGIYVPLDVATESELRATVPRLFSQGFRGLNVTLPWKGVALRVADRATPIARRCGCANSLSLIEGKIVADNTDRAAVLRRLTELRSSHTWLGETVLILGTGGAARAALDSARELGTTSFVLGRDPDRAAALAKEFGSSASPPTRLKKGDLIVHATPAGRKDADPLEIPVKPLLGRGIHVLDFVYRPEHPVLQELARIAGSSYEDGTRILTYQAAESYASWWGLRPPDESLRWGLDAE